MTGLREGSAWPFLARGTDSLYCAGCQNVQNLIFVAMLISDYLWWSWWALGMDPMTLHMPDKQVFYHQATFQPPIQFLLN